MDSSSCVSVYCGPAWNTHRDAEAYCADQGKRVCTVREVEAGACCDIGCDSDQVWVDADPVPYAELGDVGDTECPMGTVSREDCWFAGQTLLPDDASSTTPRLNVGSWADR